ncbi:TMEM165/GDT1 family protein [Candidatus Bathyarchaeota archaeon]|nr:TMEM165/GDT1 family protein [Candidatus Bathyarchaeota archaeon]
MFMGNVDLIPLFASFSMVFLAELGDKTQICTVMLSSKSSAFSIFLGAMSAFFIVNGLSVLLGRELLNFLPQIIISLVAGLIFIFFGLISLLHKNRETIFRNTNIKSSFIKTFLLISLMELGDKTQIASMLLAAQFRNPLMVLAGVMLAFSILTGIGVFLGCKILRFMPERYLKIGSSAVFITLGALIIFEAITNFQT